MSGYLRLSFASVLAQYSAILWEYDQHEAKCLKIRAFRRKLRQGCKKHREPTVHSLRLCNVELFYLDFYQTSFS